MLRDVEMRALPQDLHSVDMAAVSGQTDVVQMTGARLPVATQPVSCFPQSVVMRVIPLLAAMWAPSRDPELSPRQHQT